MTGFDQAAGAARGHAGLAYRLLQRVVAVRPEEVRAVFWCWLYIFAVLSSYYIMRPIRDQMGVAGGVKNLQWLFTGTLAGMLLLNLPFAYLVKKLPRSRFIPLTYRFFAVNILLFAAALHVASAEQTIWIGRVFFIWASVYNLFVVSVFWQLNVDLFSPEQGKRLFGNEVVMWFKQAASNEIEPASKRRQPAVLSILGSDLKIEGDIVSDGDLHISGSVTGDVVARKLTVSEGGSITGSVEADVAMIAGGLSGRLTATSVTLASTAHVVADVTHVSLLIEQGAVFEGYSRRVDSIDTLTDDISPPRLNAPTHAEAQLA